MAEFPTTARAVIIGGGIIGCSTAYHLARDSQGGRRAARAGTSSPPARPGMRRAWSGSCARRPRSPRCCKYSVELYKRLEAETGLATGWKMTGCLRLATNAGPLDRDQAAGDDGAKLRHGDAAAVAGRGARRMWPLMDVSDLVGASFLPTDGQAKPLRHHPVAGQGRAHAWRADHRGCARSPASTSTRRPRRRRSRPTDGRRSPARRWSTAPGNGRGRSARWPASTCRCSRCKHQYIDHRKDRRAGARRCRPSAIPTAAPISRRRSAGW